MSAPVLASGTAIAPGYVVIEHLSRGRRLDVYDAWSEERGCRCVIKALRPDRAGEDGPRRWLAHEGELLERFTHPHIVRAYESLAEPPLIVLETLPGETLDLIAEDPEVVLSAEELAHLGMHLGSAIRYLHRHDILHLDLKPSNAIANGQLAKLIDLSLARPPGPAPEGIGTWSYMAPEQARGGELGPPADVWGLGAVLFEMATGEPAFDDPDYDGASTGADRESASVGGEESYPQLESTAPSIAAYRGDLPPELTGLVAECLAPDPARRPSVEETLRRLEMVAGVAVGERRWHFLRELSSSPQRGLTRGGQPGSDA
jgi:eukaryotic-like serine/threonine-protein kinase